MNLHFNAQLERTLRSVVKVKFVYSNDVQSRRIEGQFGGEMLKKVFTEINIYIQHNPTILNFEKLKEVVSQCYKTCKRINAGARLGIRCHFFNDKDRGVVQIDKGIFFSSNQAQDSLDKALADFHVGSDNRTITRLNRFMDNSENALTVFITDKIGCKLNDSIKGRNKWIAKQSIWIIMDEDYIDVKKGVPEIT